MNSRNDNLRMQVKAAMMEVAIDAMGQGLDGAEALLQAFPGTPASIAMGIAWEAGLAADEITEESWWLQVERTVDLEVIKQSVLLLDGEKPE